MKISSISRRLTVTLCVVTLATLVNIVPAEAALRTGKATVKQLKGAAHYSVAKGVWIPLKLNAVLKPGALIKTAPESTVTLFFKDNGSTLTASQNSVLRLAKLTSGETGLESVSEANLELIEGSVVGSHKKTSALSALKINGIAVPSGNSFQIDSKGTAQVTKTEPTVQAALLPASDPAFNLALAQADRPQEKPSSPHGNNGVGNGEDPAPPGNPKQNDGPGTGPGNPGNGRPPRP